MKKGVMNPVLLGMIFLIIVIFIGTVISLNTGDLGKQAAGLVKECENPSFTKEDYLEDVERITSRTKVDILFLASRILQANKCTEEGFMKKSEFEEFTTQSKSKVEAALTSFLSTSKIETQKDKEIIKTALDLYDLNLNTKETTLATAQNLLNDARGKHDIELALEATKAYSDLKLYNKAVEAQLLALNFIGSDLHLKSTQEGLTQSDIQKEADLVVGLYDLYSLQRANSNKPEDVTKQMEQSISRANLILGELEKFGSIAKECAEIERHDITVDECHVKIPQISSKVDSLLEGIVLQQEIIKDFKSNNDLGVYENQQALNIKLAIKAQEIKKLVEYLEYLEESNLDIQLRETDTLYACEKLKELGEKDPFCKYYSGILTAKYGSNFIYVEPVKTV